MGAVGGLYLLQLLVGFGVIAQADPALGGLQMEAVGWLQCRNHGGTNFSLPP